MIVGPAISWPLRFRIGSAAPSRAGSTKRIDCQEVIAAAVSASPSPISPATVRPGSSKAAPWASASAEPSSPPSWTEPGMWGPAWLGTPTGRKK
jgi:hypothetical protein